MAHINGTMADFFDLLPKRISVQWRHSHALHTALHPWRNCITIIPSKLVNKDGELGICSFIFKLILGFLTGMPQVLRNKTSFLILTLAPPKTAA